MGSRWRVFSRLVRAVVTRFLLLAVCAGLLAAQSTPSSSPIQVKVVVVTMFERGEDTGEIPANISFGLNGSTSTR